MRERDRAPSQGFVGEPGASRPIGADAELVIVASLAAMRPELDRIERLLAESQERAGDER
jgi:hypothetical protein